MQAEGGDAVVFQQGGADLGQAKLGLVAGGGDIGQRQAARLHGDVDRHVGALGEHGHATFDSGAAMLVGPEQGTVEVVDEAVAVGPDDRHLAGRVEQLRLKVAAVAGFGLRLAEAAGETDRAAGAALAQVADGVDGEVAVDADESGVGRPGQIFEPSEGGDTADFGALGVDGPDRPGEAHLAALLDDAGAPRAAADHGDGAGLQQAGEVRHVAPVSLKR